MIKSKFKRVTSLFLATLMCVTTFAGIGSTTAFAASGEKSRCLYGRFSLVMATLITMGYGDTIISHFDKWLAQWKSTNRTNLEGYLVRTSRKYCVLY